MDKIYSAQKNTVNSSSVVNLLRKCGEILRVRAEENVERHIKNFSMMKHPATWRMNIAPPPHITGPFVVSR